MSRIAQKFGVSMNVLMQANKITDPSSLKVGQVLIIPGTGPVTPPKIAHYLLLGKPEVAETRAHLIMALDYVLNAGLTVGFNVDDTANAAKITIIGGVEAVSAEVEQGLRNTGHQVERISGDAYAIQRALSTLAAGKRSVRARKGIPAPADTPTGKAAVILQSIAQSAHVATVTALQVRKGRKG